jgi:hypothetical protein
MILQIFNYTIDLKKKWFEFRLKMAIREANRNARLFNKKYMVVVFSGKPLVYQKSQVKGLIKRRVFFKKGVKIEHIEKRAYYTTT